MNNKHPLANGIMAIITILLSVSTSAFALVGLSEEANILLYGHSVGNVPWSGGEMHAERGEVYRVSEILSVVEIYDNHAMSVGEMFIKNEGKEQFTEEEAIALLLLNSLTPHHQWKKITGSPLVFAFFSDASMYKNTPLEELRKYSEKQQVELINDHETKMMALVNVKDGLPNFLISKLRD